MRSTWTDPSWLAAVQEWGEARLAEARRPVVGAWEQPHARPWSTALRVATAEGPVWLKANGPGTGFEPRLVDELARLSPLVPAPLAVDAERGWTLTPDAGRPMRELTDRGLADWERLLPAYAELQRAATPHAERLAALGVPVLPPSDLPGLLAGCLDDPEVTAGLDDGEPARLRRLEAAFADWCAELTAGGISPTVQHDDLHDGNVLVADGHVSVVDWGDTAVTHPFGTLLVTFRSVAARHSLAPASPELDRLRDAYLEPWTTGHDRATLRRLADLAVAVAPLGRSLAWRRALVGADEVALAEWGPAVPGWLEELGGPPAA